MKKNELYRHVGSMQQVGYVRPVVFAEGRSANLNAVQVKSCCLDYQVMGGKCLDVSEVNFKGINISFLSKPGLQGRNHYDTNGEEAIYSIMGGMFFTAGLENICAPCNIGEVDYPMHGRIRTTPGEHISSDAYWDGDDYILKVSGEMREAALFGRNMVLRREITSVCGSNAFQVKDEIENESFEAQPMMILYHINMGYPFLAENTKLYIPTKSVTARDEAGEGHEAEYDRMVAPKDQEPEYVFIHDMKKDEEGNTCALVINEELGIGLKLSWNMKHLPYFMEWKSTASGDYVIGLEPSNSSVYGRPYHEKNGDLHMLAPFEKETNILTFQFLDGKEEISYAIEEYQKTF